VKLWIDECLSPTLVERANRRGYWATCNRDRNLLGVRDQPLHKTIYPVRSSGGHNPDTSPILKEILGELMGLRSSIAAFSPLAWGKLDNPPAALLAFGLEYVHADYQAVHELPAVEDLRVGLKITRLVGEVDPPWRPALGF